MAKEIELKFLVQNSSFMDISDSRRDIKQGYISRRPEGTVRVRICGDKAFLTVKGRNKGAVRDEWEYPVPVEDAMQMLARCTEGNVIEKTSYIVPFGGLNWEIDVFHGAHEGFVVAEIELPAPDTPFTQPPFIGREVTGDQRYYNSNL